MIRRLILLSVFLSLLVPGLLGGSLEDGAEADPRPLILSFAFHPDPHNGCGRPETPSAPAVKTKRLGRATLEFFGLMAYSQTKYWVTYGDWVEDWRYELTWEDQKKRFLGFEAWRFDSNCFNLNWTHALAGTLYYTFARTNNLSVLESFLFTTAGSLYWEYIVEWRNVISINDNLFSAFGGVPTGEVWLVLGRYFSARSGWLNRILSFLNPILKFNDWLDRNEPGRHLQDADPMEHDFSLSLGPQRRRSGIQGERNGLAGRLRTRILSIPEYGRPGQIQRGVHHTAVSELHLDVFWGDGGLEESQLFCKAALLGHYIKRIRADHTGYEVFLGLGTAFSYFRKKGTAFYDSCEVKVKRGYDLRLDEPRDFQDKFAIAHIAGPALMYDARFPHLRLRLTLDATIDFSLVNAFALNRHSEDHPISGTKTTVLHYGYYYALGASLMSGLSAELGGFRLEGSARFHYFDSIEGRDRFQAELTDDTPIGDSRLSFRASLSYGFSGSPLELRFSCEGIDRRGRMGSTRHRETESRYALGVGFRF